MTKPTRPFACRFHNRACSRRSCAGVGGGLLDTSLLALLATDFEARLSGTTKCFFIWN
uniref:Uncharacterized protein n=1 Tax=Ascaris lumbricoides TaxID=6252 RepID=A0A0M3INH0_ASCLU